MAMGRSKKTHRIVALAVFLLVSTYFVVSLFQIPTIAGDNLQPTPWHRSRNVPISERIRRIPKVLSCNNRCPMSDLQWDPDPEVVTPQGNSSQCPDYFKWILEDLSPWQVSGITRHTLERANKAAFRVVILNGKLFVEPYYRCMQSRMLFTIAGILQMLHRFPGQVPDLEMFFNCQDRPVLTKTRQHSPPPPLFGYSSTDEHFDIVFPDWSFWGWSELNIPPWKDELERIVTNSQQLQWTDRDPNAFWRGNIFPNKGVTIRSQLASCNKTADQDYNAYIYGQDWFHNDPETSKLEAQCHHRYKIYVEGFSWSVSYKYILACGSTVLKVASKYYDFFTRGLLPNVHYLPIDPQNMCEDIKATVEWGNSHPEEAAAVGESGQRFLEETVNIEAVYEYMVHLLQEYSKLQRFKPKLSRGAQFVCDQTINCLALTPAMEDMLRMSTTSPSRQPLCVM